MSKWSLMAINRRGGYGGAYEGKEEENESERDGKRVRLWRGGASQFGGDAAPPDAQCQFAPARRPPLAAIS